MYNWVNTDIYKCVCPHRHQLVFHYSTLTSIDETENSKEKEQVNYI